MITNDYLDRVKDRYWSARSYLSIATQLFRYSNRGFAAHLARDYLSYLLNTVTPVKGETQRRARAAVDWLIRAQDSSPDDGVSLGFFPCHASGTFAGWRASYPETTGYIIPSLLQFSERFNDARVRERALRMASWETTIQMPSGAVQGGPVCPPEHQEPAVFNTGMVLHGYTAAFEATKADEFLEFGQRAADFLLNDLTEDGHFRTHGKFVRHQKYKTYNCLCAWPLYVFGQSNGEKKYCKAAVRIIEAAIEQQHWTGWFPNNCFTNSAAPISHTICYTLQGILEVGLLAGREDFIASAERGTNPLLQRISDLGFLHGSFFADWTPASRYACLTGNAQLAIICYRLYDKTGDAKYKTASDLLVNYLKALQVLESDNPGINGALPGSFPILGSYMTAGYPNWATKYFLDALLLQDRFEKS